MISKSTRTRARAPLPDRPLTELVDATIAARLARFGIVRTADWAELTPRKRQSFFGVTPSMVTAINAAVTGVTR